MEGKPTTFVVAGLTGLVLGDWFGDTIRYTATLTCDGHTLSDDGTFSERGDAVITLNRTREPFPWHIGQIVELDIPWDGGA